MLTVKPGVHILAEGKLEILVHAEGEEQYYVRVSKSGSSFGVKLALIPREQGEEESYPFTPERQFFGGLSPHQTTSPTSGITCH
ncbi:MAG TPA: hypothetical protein VJW94_19675 [Candidatus Acidoferrum sp.]|nr:hypothetical protein [Candidatus Acidoferrum sp.]